MCFNIYFHIIFTSVVIFYWISLDTLMLLIKSKLSIELLFKASQVKRYQFILWQHLNLCTCLMLFKLNTLTVNWSIKSILSILVVSILMIISKAIICKISFQILIGLCLGLIILWILILSWNYIPIAIIHLIKSIFILH